MSKRFVLLSLLILLPLSVSAVDFPSFPMAFWGTATINGQPLSSGTKIEAHCTTDLVGSVIMLENGIYGYAESAKVKLLVGGCSGDILFKYILSGTATSLTGASEIKYTSGFQSGITVNKNINFITVQSCSIANGTGSQTWNGSVWGNCTVVSCNSSYHQSGNTCVADPTGGGGGGGGGTTPTVPPTTPITTKTGDANGDGKVDKYDFSLMMANWGKTGTNSSDFNNDGKIDKYDFALLMSKWGT